MPQLQAPGLGDGHAVVQEFISLAFRCCERLIDLSCLDRCQHVLEHELGVVPVLGIEGQQQQRVVGQLGVRFLVMRGKRRSISTVVSARVRCTTPFS